MYYNMYYITRTLTRVCHSVSVVVMLHKVQYAICSVHIAAITENTHCRAEVCNVDGKHQQSINIDMNLPLYKVNNFNQHHTNTHVHRVTQRYYLLNSGYFGLYKDIHY